MVKTRIIVKFQVEGTHAWKDCPFEEVAYLKNPHRHVFHVTAKKTVNHDNRDIEIIMLKRYMQMWLSCADRSAVNFHDRSCETIARHYLEKFDLDYCSVLEDNENGAEIFKVEEPSQTHPVYTEVDEKKPMDFNSLFGDE